MTGNFSSLIRALSNVGERVAAKAPSLIVAANARSIYHYHLPHCSFVWTTLVFKNLIHVRISLAWETRTLFIASQT